jgi:hypothetical protein
MAMFQAHTGKGDFGAPICFDELREASQIRSRLAALREMERHLVQISKTIQRARALSPPLTETRPLTAPHYF